MSQQREQQQQPLLNFFQLCLARVNVEPRSFGTKTITLPFFFENLNINQDEIEFYSPQSYGEHESLCDPKKMVLYNDFKCFAVFKFQKINIDASCSLSLKPTLLDFDAQHLVVLLQSNKSVSLTNVTLQTTFDLSFCDGSIVGIISIEKFFLEPFFHYFYDMTNVISQFENDNDGCDLINQFVISSTFANGIDIDFCETKTILARGILSIKLRVSKCYHNKPDLFLLRSSVLKKNIEISNVKYINDYAILLLSNNSLKDFSSKRFLVLNFNPFMNCNLHIHFNNVWKHFNFALNNNLPIPIDYKNINRKKKLLFNLDVC